MNESLPLLLLEKGDHFVQGLLFQFNHGLKSDFLLAVCYSSLVLLLMWCIIEFHKCAENLMDRWRRKMPSFHILIIGGQNSGKTATQAYLARQKMTSRFPLCPNLKYACNNMLGYKFIAAKWKNTPQFGSDSLDDIQFFVDNLKKMTKYLKNFQVLVFCLPLHKILTKDSIEYIKAIKSVFGQEIFKRHVIFVFTHGDTLEAPKKRDVSNFEEWLSVLEPCILKDVLKECNNRCVLLHNKTDNEKTKREQAVRIFSMCLDIFSENALFRVREEVKEMYQKDQGDITFVQHTPTELSDLLLTEESSKENDVKLPIAPEAYINNVDASKQSGLCFVEPTPAELRSKERVSSLTWPQETQTCLTCGRHIKTPRDRL